MSVEAWAGLIITAIGMMGVFTAWLVNVSIRLGEISANTATNCDRADGIEQSITDHCKVIYSKLDKHAEKLEGLRTDVTRLDQSLARRTHPHPS